MLRLRGKSNFHCLDFKKSLLLSVINPPIQNASIPAEIIYAIKTPAITSSRKPAG